MIRHLHYFIKSVKHKIQSGRVCVSLLIGSVIDSSAGSRSASTCREPLNVVGTNVFTNLSNKCQDTVDELQLQLNLRNSFISHSAGNYRERSGTNTSELRREETRGGDDSAADSLAALVDISLCGGGEET
ncbi:hypothetical protein F2P81_024731 [Scophthalmus maximus]|uniref:Uncharacterized protein n=1 Tax=Scophthalmus maximus TaxID=52904 RepID=A0A6A4RTQ3_SCOMX|nr:hypothetical protein F2P81_024731 [Scophthalmus maximus]